MRPTQSGVHIEGFPDAAMAVKLTGYKAQQIADFALHKFDLGLAIEFLEAINNVPPEMSSVRQGLWRAAIEHCMKCFSPSSSRSKLDAKRVYRGEGQEVYGYFRDLRNKHIAHDENSYMQCVPGAILNKPEAKHKIAKIVCFTAIAETLEQANYSNLHKMITDALDFVIERFDTMCDDITKQLESEPYEQLAAMESMTYSKPTVEDMGRNRPRHSQRRR